MVRVDRRDETTELIESFSDDSTQDMITTNRDIEALVQSYNDEIDDDGKDANTDKRQLLNNELETKLNSEMLATIQSFSGKLSSADKVNNNKVTITTDSLNNDKVDEIVITNRQYRRPSSGIRNKDTSYKAKPSEIFISNKGIVSIQSFPKNYQGKVSIPKLVTKETECANREMVSVESLDNELGNINRMTGIDVMNSKTEKFGEVVVNDIIENGEIISRAEVYTYENLDGNDEERITLNNNIPSMMGTYCDEEINKNLVNLYGEKIVGDNEMNRNNETATALVPYIEDTVYNEISITNEMRAPVELYINDTAGGDVIIRNMDGGPVIEPYNHGALNENEFIEIYPNENLDEYDLAIRDGNTTIEGVGDDFGLSETAATVTYSDEKMDNKGVDIAANNIEIPAAIEFCNEGKVDEDGIIRGSVIASTVGSYNNDMMLENGTNTNMDITARNELCADAMDEEQAMRESVIATIESLTEEREKRERNAMVDLYNGELIGENSYEMVNDNGLVQLYSDQTVNVVANEEYCYENIDERLNNAEVEASMVLFNSNIAVENMEASSDIEMTKPYDDRRVDENIIFSNLEMAGVAESYSEERVNGNEMTNSDGIDSLEGDRMRENIMIVSTVESFNNRQVGADKITGIVEMASKIELYSEETVDNDAVNSNREKTQGLEGLNESSSRKIMERKGEGTETTELGKEEVVKVKVNREILTEPNTDKVAKKAKKKKSKAVEDTKVNKKRERKAKTDSYREEKEKKTKVRTILKESYNDERIDEQTWKNREKSAIALIMYSMIMPFKTSSGFKCFYCDETYGDIAVLTTHTRSTHDSPDETQIRNAMSKLKKYHLIKVNVVNVACKLCDDTITNFTELKKHIAGKHEIDIDEVNDGVIPFKIANGECECVLCGVKFPGSKGLSSHMNEHFPHHTCLECGLGFMTIERLKSHSLVHTLESHPCEICGKEYKSESAKYNHFRIVHKNEKVSKCPHCSETFTSYYTRQRHILSVHGIKTNQYHCEICPHTFLMKNLLTSHMETVHTKRTKSLDRPHKCTECEMRFTRQSYLRDHMVKHTGTRNFQCNVCLKWYGRKKTLTAHKRAVHSIRAKIWAN